MVVHFFMEGGGGGTKIIFYENTAIISVFGGKMIYNVGNILHKVIYTKFIFERLNGFLNEFFILFHKLNK